MTFDDLLDQFAQLPNRVYSYVVIAAVAGPLALKVFGFGALGRIVRPVALAVLLGGMYAKQQRARTSS